MRGLGLAALLLVGLRLPSLLLPELGRDEASYLYWAHHPRWGYGPLLQLLLRGVEGLGSILALRSIGLIAMAAAAFCMDRWLTARQFSREDRRWALLFVLTAPWTVLTSSLIHPDALLLAFLLAGAWSARQGWWFRLGVAALGAALAKPTGLVVVATAVVWMSTRPRARARWSALALAIAVVPLLFALDGELVRALTQFARPDQPDFDRLSRLALLFATAVLLGGPVLVVAGSRGLQGRRFDFETLTAVSLLVLFVGAALVTGQAKGNWILPAFVLSWTTLRLRPPFRALALGVNVVLSLAIGIGFAAPGLVERLEGTLNAPSYLSVAGAREADVSSARAWSHRLREYRGFARFEDDVVRHLGPQWPARIVSDDYGLAAQLAVRCPTGPPVLVLPRDPVFAPATPVEGAWVVAAREDPSDLVSAPWSVESVAEVPHPAGGAPITLGRVRRQQRSSEGVH